MIRALTKERAIVKGANWMVYNQSWSKMRVQQVADAGVQFWSWVVSSHIIIPLEFQDFCINDISINFWYASYEF
jgi:hypothetical protein